MFTKNDLALMGRRGPIINKKERDNGQTIQAKNIIIFVQLVRLRGC